MAGGGVSFSLASGWDVEFQPLPSEEEHAIDNLATNGNGSARNATRADEGIILASIPLAALYACNDDAYRAFAGEEKDADDDGGGGSAASSNSTGATNNAAMAGAARVALADYAARTLAELLPITNNSSADSPNGHDNGGGCSITVRTMGQAKHSASANAANNSRRRRKKNDNPNNGGKKKKGGGAPMMIPYVLERTDCVVVQQGGDFNGKGSDDNGKGKARLQFFLHASFSASSSTSSIRYSSSSSSSSNLKRALEEMLSPTLDGMMMTKLRDDNELTSRGCFAHVACVVLQHGLRSMLQPPRRRTNSVGAAAEQNANQQAAAAATAAGSNINNNEGKKADQVKLPNDNKNDSNNNYLNAVAFIADGSLLPRKSGRSILPMPSPPAVPFQSPEGSEQLTRVVTVEVGKFWRRYLNEDGSVAASDASGSGVEESTAMETTSTALEDEITTTTTTSSSSVTMRGMIIPTGVTLIVGGGYHGKSTMLQALCMGVYDTVPGDGRERCVAHADAVSVRAEDGRYVHNANVSAFISHLPSGRSVNGASISSERDTSRFGTKDASGSTSQAANVIEALEGGASALLVDEDVSAANFMARDGRMRAMIMDEPITPLLYRVNGLYVSEEHAVSTVVVVGGVGEWLDVADAVVLMKDYAAYDGLKKARSVSYQFSYGHVQYGGRGVVHRLPWEVTEEKRMVADGGDGTNADDGDAMSDGNEGKEPRRNATLNPLRRRPENQCVARKFQDAAVHLLESGSSRLWFYRDDDDDEEAADDGNDAATLVTNGNTANDEDDGMVDMSKCSQLVGNASEQLYACGVCVLWLIQESLRRPQEDLPDLLDRMEEIMNHGNNGIAGGMNELVSSLKKQSQDTADNDVGNSNNNNKMVISELLSSHDMLDLWETVGFAYRPRRHEVAMALTRMRGMKFDILPAKPRADDAFSKEEEAKRLEEESRKRALAELWANRRKR